MVAEKVLIEDWPYELPEYEFQDRYLYDSARKFSVLIKWDIDEENNPGFRPVILIEKTKEHIELDRIAGCCKTLSAEKNNLLLDVFRGSGVEKVKVKIPKLLLT